jgi:hypothetical protein
MSTYDNMQKLQLAVVNVTKQEFPTDIEGIRELVQSRLRDNGVDGQPLVNHLSGQEVDRLVTMLISVHMFGLAEKEIHAPAEGEEGYLTVPRHAEEQQISGQQSSERMNRIVSKIGEILGDWFSNVNYWQ